MKLTEYLNAINHTKENLLDTADEFVEKEYPPYVINRCLSYFTDTIFHINELNGLSHIDKKLQFDFLINSLRPRKRFTPWLKAKKLENLDYVKEFYGYNNAKAKSALDILSEEQISTIKRKLFKGGKDGRD